jgi:hypothetical protein
VKATSWTSSLLGTVALSAALTAPSARALTLDTTWMQANAVFSLSMDAFDAMDVAGVSMTALGNASNARGTVLSDGSVLSAFNLPVTKVDVSVGFWPFANLVTPEWGEASGSALQISRGTRNVTLANFFIDYDQSLVLADITANGSTQKRTSLYAFDATNLKIGLNGLTLNMNQTLSNLTLTDSALATFASGLNLSRVLQAPLVGLDFGTIKVDINGALRHPINSAPYVVASIPEPSSVAMLALGLIGIAAVSRRKMAN